MSAMKNLLAEAAELLDMDADVLTEALEAADKVQAVTDLTTKWSHGQADASQTLLAVHRVVTS